MQQIYQFKKNNHNIFIQEGFSIKAFLLNIFWLINIKAFKESVLFFIFQILLFIIAKSVDFQLILIVEIVFLSFIGVNASYIMEKTLTKRGYRLENIFFVENIETARLKSFETNNRGSNYDKRKDRLSNKNFKARNTNQ